MEFRLKITRRARRDFDEIARFETGDTGIPNEFARRLLEFAESLTIFPRRHRRLEGKPDIHKAPFGSFIILYKIHDSKKVVEIFRFWHASQDPRGLRLKEEAKLVYGGEAQIAK